jgi:uncharacterized membrane protein
MQLASRAIVYVTVLTAVGCGLMGGILFAFSNFVMQALSLQPAASGIRTMQEINIQIVNPLFLTIFIGTPVAAAFLTALAMRSFSQPGARLLLIGSVLYLVGTLAVTVAFNIPLNNQLAIQDPMSVDASGQWIQYVAKWIRWNHVRTIASLTAAALLTLAIRQISALEEH